MRSQLCGVGALLLGIAITVTVVSEGMAQNSKTVATDEVFNLAFRPQSEYTAAFRASFAKALAKYCRAVLNTLPTNTPEENAWVTSEGHTTDGAKIQRLVNSKEYSRSMLKTTFSDCKDTATLLIEFQESQKHGTEWFSRLEADQFVKLALNLDISLESYSSKVEMSKDVKSVLDDLHLHIIRQGLLRVARDSLKDVQK